MDLKIFDVPCAGFGIFGICVHLSSGLEPIQPDAVYNKQRFIGDLLIIQRYSTRLRHCWSFADGNVNCCLQYIVDNLML